MDYLSLAKIMDPILNAGVLLLIFPVFVLIGLVNRLGVQKAVRAGLMVTVGFGGVYILVDFFLSKMAPAAQAFVLRFGGAHPYTDNGWQTFYSFAFAWPATYGVVAIGLFINLVMLLFSMTDTLNLNIRDYWLAGVTAIITTLLSGSLTAGLVLATFILWMSLMLSDFFAQHGYSAALDLPDLTFFLGGGAVWVIFSHYLGMLLDKIKRSEKKNNPDHPIRDHPNLKNEPALLGVALGLFLGIGGGLYWVDIAQLVISLAIALVLIPYMTGFVRQALKELRGASDGMLAIGKNGRKIFIGIDPAVAAGEPSVLITTVLMVPILLALSIVIPGTSSVPFADLAALLFFWVFAALPQRLDLPRTLLACTLMALFGMLAAARGVDYWSDMVARNAGVIAPAGMGITAWFNHLSPELLVAGLLGERFEMIGLNGIIILCVVGILVTGAFRINYLRKQKNLCKSVNTGGIKKF